MDNKERGLLQMGRGPRDGGWGKETKNMIRRMEKCVHSEGEHFEVG